MTRFLLLAFLTAGGAAAEYPLALPPAAEKVCAALGRPHGIEPKEGAALLSTIESMGTKLGVSFSFHADLRGRVTGMKLSHTDTATLCGKGWSVVWTLRRLLSADAWPQADGVHFVPRGAEGGPACVATFLERGMLASLAGTAGVRVRVKANRAENRRRITRMLLLTPIELEGEVSVAAALETLSGVVELSSFHFLLRIRGKGYTISIPKGGVNALDLLDLVVRAVPDSTWGVFPSKDSDAVVLREKKTSSESPPMRLAVGSSPAHVRAPESLAVLRRQLAEDGFRLLFTPRFQSERRRVVPYPSPRSGETVRTYLERLFPEREGYVVVWCLEHVAVFLEEELD